MREILFRGKRLYVDEWVYGTLIICQGKYYIATDTTKITASYTAISGDGTSDGWHYNICGLREVNPETVGQYTGLTDKNGKKIFEGDIVEYKDERAAIQWDADTARYIVEFDSYLMDFDNLYGHEVEVIGNIHDNPELLEV